METAITVLIMSALLILSIVGLSQTALSTQASLAESSGQMQERVGERARTSLTALGAQTSSAGDSVQITLKNSGSTKLADLQNWDVILQYSDGPTQWAMWYPNGDGSNHWVEQNYQAASTLAPEVINPGILDPGEEAVVTVTVSPPVGSGTTNLAVVAVPNGISASTVFTH
jgi:flagellar protein FlaF